MKNIKKLMEPMGKCNSPSCNILDGKFSYLEDIYEFKMHEESNTSLNMLIDESGHNLQTVLLSLVVILLNKCMESKDIVIWSELYEQDSGGCATIAVSLRETLENEITYRDLLLRIKTFIKQSDGNANNIFSEGYDKPDREHFRDSLNVPLLITNYQTFKYVRQINSNLSFVFSKENKGLTGVIKYNKALCDEEAIIKIVESLTALINLLNSDLDIKLSKVYFKECIVLSDSSVIPVCAVQPEAEQVAYKLSLPQERLYALQQFDTASTAYNLLRVLEIDGDLDVKRLEEAFVKLIKRHEILRASFHANGEEIVQIIHKAFDFKIEYSEAMDTEIEEIISSFIKPFDLSKGPIIRAVLVKLQSKKYMLIWDMHNIISDEASSDILLKELIRLYEDKPLEEQQQQYKDYLYRDSEKQSKEQQEAYWLELLNGEIPVLNLPTDYQRPQVQSFEGDCMSFELGRALSSGLRKLCGDNDTTIKVVLLAGINILLSRYSGQEDILVGSMVAGRRCGELENIIGIFENTIVLRNYPNGEKTFKEFIGEVKENILKAYEYQDYQFEELVEKLNTPRDMSRNPIFDVMFNFILRESESIVPDSNAEGALKLKSYDAGGRISKFDLTLHASQREETLLFEFEYCTKLFKKETIERMAVHFDNILAAIAENNYVLLSEIEILTELEKQRIIFEYNNTEAYYPKNKLIHEIFEEQAEKTPDNTAISYGGSKLTYRELNAKSNSLARVLRTSGVKPDEAVGIMVERSLEMVIGIMAILKAGGAYLPIDPQYPAERVEYMLADSGARLLLTQERFLDKISGGRTAINLEAEELYKEAGSNLKAAGSSSSLAYIIYTSGSTGKPKGVMVEHYSVVNRLNWMQKKYCFDQTDVILQKTPFTFDVSVWELFQWTLAGASLHMLDVGGEKDPAAIVGAVEETGITIMHFVPSMLSVFTEFIKDQAELERLKSLKHIFASGEALSKKHVEAFNGGLNKRFGVRLHNLYGPTEATVEVSYYDCPVTGLPEIIPIGKPIDNIKFYILNNAKKLQPVGVIGELYIGGEGVARGYLNKPELTAEKFVPDFLEPRKIMYKTGDLARWLPDGNVEFLGRTDHQVKIRGFRIEIGEIENRLLSHIYIKEAVVIAKEEVDKSKYLCAYVSSDKALSTMEIKEYLSGELPNYMIPSYIIRMEKLPLTPNGKINRNALPDVKTSMQTDIEYDAPRDEIDEKLVEIWQEVLGVEKVGINNSFFELGGHSLKAMNLIARIHKQLKVEIPLNELFKTPTIKRISEYVKKTGGHTYSAIKKAEAKEYYRASSAQKRIYALQEFDRGSTAYNMPEIIEIEGVLDSGRLEEALRNLVQRHESLRTVFAIKSGEIVQSIHAAIVFEIEYEDKTAYAEEARIISEADIKSFVRAFDLSKGPLIRARLIRMAADKHIIMIDMHHIISDGVSIGILIKELGELYSGKMLSELKLQYKDYAEWQCEQHNTEKIKSLEKYWIEQFAGEVPVLEMPTDHPRPSIQSFEGDSISFRIEEALVEKLYERAKASDCTLYMVLLAALNILLSKYSGQEDIVIGSPAAGRNHADLEKIVGMFVNTLAMRSYPKGEKSIKEFIGEVKETALRAYENQDYQLEELVEKLNALGVLPARDLSRNPLFSVMLVLHNMDIEDIYINDICLKNYEIENKVSKFDITVTAIEQENGININMQYCTRLYNKDTICRLSSHMQIILKRIAECPDEKLKDIELLTEEERCWLLTGLNSTKAEYPPNNTVQEMFEKQVEKTPHNIAVVHKDTQLTYSELNQRANQLAVLLRAKGAKADTMVGIMVERSIDMLVGIMGVLKAGAAYMPVDPEYPRERIEFMLNDSNAFVLLTQKKLTKHCFYEIETVLIDEEGLYKGNAANLEPINESSSLVYVIYTSGTTGLMKGVMVQHNNLLNYVNWFTEKAGISDKEKTMLLSSYAFDLGYTSLYTSILKGAELHIIDKDVYTNPEKLLDYICDNAISYIKLTPSLYNIVCNADGFKDHNRLKPLRLVVLGGEEINTADVKRTYKQHKSLEIMNHYGPAETTIGTAAYLIEREREESFIKNPVIGKPISNNKAYILNNYMKLQLPGVAGELCISGEGVARGYLNRPELTVEKFVDNPFEPGTKLYRTGDIARWRMEGADSSEISGLSGTLEFIGRVDNQVKIRGFRIELGEIESRLLSHGGIKYAVVLVKKDESGNKYLCAYIVTVQQPLEFCTREPGAGEAGLLTVEELRSFLAEELPEYMIPSYFIQLEDIPLTPNGKVDWKTLPEPNGNTMAGRHYEAPRDKIEEKLAEMWRTVLNVEEISINSSFFELGGHSLKAVNLIANIHKELNVEIPLSSFFKLSTIKGISDYIKRAENNIYSNIERTEKKEYYRTSSAQKRIYALQEVSQGGVAYNMPEILEIEGELSKARLKETFERLFQRHEIFRTSFEIKDEGIMQKIHETVNFEIEYDDRTKKPGQTGELLQRDISSFVRAFDLSKAPLIRVALIKAGSAKYIMLLDMHHIIFDGVSREIFLREFTELYSGKDLPELRLQYKDYSEWQNEQYNTERMKKQESYWLEQLAGELPILNMRTDYPRQSVQSFEGDSVSFELGAEQTERLRQLCRDTGVTMYMLLLTALNILLSKYSGQEDIIIGSPVSGRFHGDLESICGMFVNTLAIRNYPDGGKAFKAFLEEVKVKCLEVYQNQEYQFETLIEKLNLRRDFSRNPLFDVMFNFILREPESIVPDSKAEGALKLKSYDAGGRISKFDLTLHASQREETLLFEFEYCAKLFKKETIERMAVHFDNILAAIAENNYVLLSEIEILTALEKQRIIFEYNNTEAYYPKNKLIHEIFEEQAEKTPHNNAISYGGSKLTYRELNTKSNSLARVLRTSGVKPDEAVGIMVERSLEMVIGIMAILKAGGAYLPIDPQYPAERVEYMLADSGARLLLTQERFLDKISGGRTAINLEAEELYKEAGSNLKAAGSSSSLAYIIYTSGSTGKPKGVMVEHYSVVNRLNWMQKKYCFDQTDVILQKTPFTFDVSVWELFQWTLAGASLHMLAVGGEKDPAAIVGAVEETGITIMHFVPSMLSVFTEFIKDQAELERLKSLKHIFASGEALSKKHVEAFNGGLNKRFGVRLHNLYGPTEATVEVSYYDCPVTGLPEIIPIGKPIDNIKFYIFDKYSKLQPVGIPGELYIGGAGVARGYINRAELTREKFIQTPEAEGDRLYRTGDLARWLDDGNIEFLGRIDHQVKIRGFRIELGEIENRLLSHEDIKEAVVITKEDDSGNKYLCAYIVSTCRLTVKVLRDYISMEIPEYMIPSQFINIENIPLNQNGKVDRNKLVSVKGQLIGGAEKSAPKNETEKIISDIWNGLLGLQDIGVNEDFYGLGGNSLNLIEMLAKVNKKFGVSLAVGQVLGIRTVEQLGEMIKKYMERKKEDICVLMNKAGSRKVFCFPPISGYGNYIKPITAELEDYSFYSFSYIESEDVVDIYVKRVLKEQNSGPYVLYGFCIGGRLAYHVAHRLEQLGYEVSDLIFIDTEPGFTAGEMKEEDIDEQLEVQFEGMAYNKRFASIIESAVRKRKHYFNYLNNIVDNYTVKSNIYCVHSEESRNNMTLWSKLTEKKMKIYEGPGCHDHILKDNLVYYIDIIRNILEEIFGLK